MADAKTIWLCARADFRKWPVNPRIWAMAACLAALLPYSLKGLGQLSASVGVALTPWIFPNLLNSSFMFVVFGGFATILFCDAPFADSHMPFVMIRAGRRNWTAGQLLYIAMASAAYTMYFFIISVLALIPHLQWSADWGTVFRTLAADPDFAFHRGISLSVGISPQIIAVFSPIQATLISLGLFWLTSVFIGALIFCLNVVSGRMGGLVAAGVLVALSYFCVYLGPLTLGGTWIRWFSPLNWSGMYCLDWSGRRQWNSSSIDVWPPAAYGISVLLGAVLLLGLTSVAVFCRKDMNLQERRR
jgi:hypothetical protein